MTNWRQIAIGIVAALAFVAVAIGGTTFVGAMPWQADGAKVAQAAAPPSAAETPTPPGVVQSLFTRAARILGIEEQKLKDAFAQAAKEGVDEAVKSGRLGQEQADKLKEGIDKGINEGRMPMQGMQARPRFKSPEAQPPVQPKRGPGLKDEITGRLFAFRHPATVDAAAKVLGMTRDEVVAELRKGKSVSEIAAERGVSRAALVEGITKELSASIQKKADEAIKNLTQQVEKLVDSKGLTVFGEKAAPKQSRPKVWGQSSQ